MHNHYEAAQAIEVGRARDVVMGWKMLLTWVDSLGIPFRRELETFDDFEE